MRGRRQLPAQGPNQPQHRLRLARTGISGLDDGGLQRLARTPVMGPVEQPGLADPAKRAAQHGRQRQIVGGLEQVFGQHDQVAHRDFLLQLEPVGPGHAHAPGLEPLGQGADEWPGARPHQDHDVLGPHRALSPLQPARIARRGIAPGPARNAVGEDFGQLHFGAAFLVFVIVEQVDRRVLVLRRRLDLRPDLDQPASPRLTRQVLGPAFTVEGQPAGVVAVAEQAIDRGQDRLRRAEGDVERLRDPLLSGALDVVLEAALHGLKHLRIGALEAVDRLLEIADDEAGAEALVGATHLRVGAVVKGAGQPSDDGPLVGVGVLRLVDEHVAQALIEFEGDPQPRPGLGGQQTDGAQDQVVEIDPAARGFVGLVVVEHVKGRIQQRLGNVSLLQGLHGVAQRVDPLLLSFQSLQSLGVQRHKGLGQQLGENAGFVFARQEQVVIDPPFQPPC